MFKRFRTEFSAQTNMSDHGAPWLVDQLRAGDGYSEFAAELAGTSFAGGLYRFHDETTGPLSMALIGEALPELRARACPFGYDWLGRQFALDSGRSEGGQPLVLLFEPGTGEALEIPVTFTDFHNEELTNFADAALAREFSREWAARNSGSIPLTRDVCVGYRVPLFLGGKDVVENLELSDLDVYWSIWAQLRTRARRLPPPIYVEEAP